MGYDVDAARRRAMARAGVEIAQMRRRSPPRRTTIITSLPKPAALEATDRGDRRGATFARGSSSRRARFTLDDKHEAERSAAQGRTHHARLSGERHRRAGKVKDLVIYASGDSKAIRKLRPLFAAFARAAHDLGAFGNGSRMKYVANLLVAINNVASAEAMVLGLKAGLDPRNGVRDGQSGAGNSRVFELRAPMMVKDRYDDPTMKISVWQKDMAVIGEFARQLRCPTPMFDATVPIYNKAMRSGHAEQDTAAVCAVLEKMAGVKRGNAKTRTKRTEAARAPPHSRRKSSTAVSASTASGMLWRCERARSSAVCVACR